MDRKQLSSLIIYSSLATVAAMALTCRYFVAYQGQAIQLLLVASSIASVAVLVAENENRNGSTNSARLLFAALTILNLSAWASNIAFALLLTLPIALSIGLPKLLEMAGWKLTLRPLFEQEIAPPVAQPETVSNPSNDDPQAHEPAEQETDGHRAIGSIEELGEQNLVEQSDSAEKLDPWSAVQQLFVIDSSLTQNMAQWQQPDGSRCIVANVRCLFSTSNETSVVHLPFWPLLVGKPEVFCRVASGPDATIKTTENQSHGLRLEVRLNESPSDFPVDVIVEVVATSSVPANEQAA